MIATGIAGGLAAAATAQAPDPRLRPAAHEFEACMMKELLEPLQKETLAGGEAGDGGDEGSESALTSFGSEALARAISDHGGFGIATKIIEHFSHGRSGAGGSSEMGKASAEQKEDSTKGLSQAAD